VLGIVIGVETFLAMFMAPSFTAGAISGEKERQTFDLLRTTLLPARWFVTGKLLSALSYVFLLILASLPLQSIAFMLGGVSWVELVISQLLIMVAAITYALFGLFCSSIMKSTLSASVLTFAGILFFTMGLPSFALFVVAILSPFMYGVSSSWITEAFLAIGALLLATTNLPATLITSAVFLIDSGGIFYITQDFYSGGATHSIPLPSPWTLFILFHLILSLLIYWLTVRRVRRISNK
jgi:ABC-type transport system involved in multi-copper enzyme maturation permease subunit